MTVINPFSKFAYAVSLKAKTDGELVRALEPKFVSNKVKYLKTNNGKEYYNSTVQALINRYKMKHYSMYSEKKASNVKRFNRRLKMRMYRAFREQGHYRWLTLLPELMNAYNNSVHRSTAMKPR